MTRTAFYALDQEQLSREDWDLADAFARLHEIASGDGAVGVARITIADLMLVLDGWETIEESERFRAHRSAVARIRQALGPGARAPH
jgi:hypothetical protein